MDRIENTKKNLSWGIANRILLILLPFLARTVIIYLLGLEYAGLDGLFTSILTVLNLTELGLGSAIAYSMYKPVAENKVDEVCSLLNFYRKCFRVLAIVILIVGLLLVPVIPYMTKGEVPNGINLQILYLFFLGNTVCTYLFFAYRSVILKVNLRMDVQSKITSLTSVLRYILQILVLVITHNYYYYAVVLICGTVLNNLLTAYYSKKLFPQYICYGHVSKDKLNAIWLNVKGLFAQRIGSVVLISVDSIVISAFLGLRTLSIYQNYMLIINAVASLIGVYQDTLIPAIGNSVVTEGREKNYKDFTVFNFILFWIVTVCSSALVGLYQPFISVWVGADKLLSNSYIPLLGMYFFFHHFGDISYIYKSATGIWWEGRKVPIVAAIVNLVLNIVLVQMIGLPGVFISTIVSLIFVYSLWGWTYIFQFYFRLQGSYKTFIITQGWHTICAIICIGLTYFLCLNIHGNYIVQLFVNAFICLSVSCGVILLFHFRRYEYKVTKDFIKSIIIKRG